MYNHIPASYLPDRLTVFPKKRLEKIYPFNLGMTLSLRQDYGKMDYMALMGCVAELDKDSQRIIHMRYVAGLTYKAVAEELDVPVNTAGTRINNVVRKLRRRVYAIQYRTVSLDTYSELQAEHEALKEHYEALKALTDTIEVPEVNNPAIETLADYAIYIDRPIYDLDLSSRAFNALYRSRVEKIRDLIAHTPEELKKIRNLGNVLFNEVVNALNKEGLSLKKEDNNDSNH